jgi:DNA-binding protein HU-beta
MNKTDLIKKIKKNNGITIDESTTIVNDIFNEIQKSLEEGKNVSLSGFGTWNVSILKGRDGKVPKSKKEYKSEDKYVVRFKPSKNTKEKVANRKVN